MKDYIFYRKFLRNEDDDGLPLKNVRRLSDINIDDVSKSSVEAKMCLEVAMEEIKEQGHKIRQLKKKVNRLESVVCDLRSLIKELKYKKFLSKSNDTLSVSYSNSLFHIDTCFLCNIRINKKIYIFI